MANGRGGRSAKKIQLFPRQTVGFNIESTMVSGIKNLEAMVREKVLRSATFAASDVMYKEMRLRVPVKEGSLYAAIYQYHDDKKSTKFRQVYAIGPNKVKAQHWYVVEYGHWRYNKFINGRPQRSKSNPSARGPASHDLPGALEVPVWVPAIPYIRPTYDAKIGAISRVFNQRARERFSELAKGGE